MGFSRDEPDDRLVPKMPSYVPPPAAGAPVGRSANTGSERAITPRGGGGWTGPVKPAVGHYLCPVCAMGYRVEELARVCCEDDPLASYSEEERLRQTRYCPNRAYKRDKGGG